MAVLMTAGAWISAVFWRALEMLGWASKVAGATALLGAVIVLSDQTLTFMREDYWPSRSLLPAIPDTVVGWLIAGGDLAGISVLLVDFLYRVPLWVAALAGGILALLLGKILTYKGNLTVR